MACRPAVIEQLAGLTVAEGKGPCWQKSPIDVEATAADLGNFADGGVELSSALAAASPVRDLPRLVEMSRIRPAVDEKFRSGVSTRFNSELSPALSVSDLLIHNPCDECGPYVE